MRVRLLLDGPRDAALNMAIDDVLVQGCRAGGAPVLRFYRWSERALTLGRFQSFKVLDRAACAADSVAVVRRITGGRAVLHGDDLTYSVAAPAGRAPFPDDIRGTFFAVSRGLVAGLARLGIAAEAVDAARADARGTPLCFAATSWYEITLHGRKLIGSAQRRWREAFLQQGSMPLRFDAAEFYRYFSFEHEAERARAVAAAAESVATLAPLLPPGIPIEAVQRALASGFEEGLGLELEPGTMTPAELRDADRLARARYADADWTAHRWARD
jgi:lipoate-protein ligase A